MDMLPHICRYNPPWYGAPGLGQAVQDYFPSIFPLFPHLVNQSHPPTATTGPLKGGVQTMTMAGGGGAYTSVSYIIYIYI